MNKTINFHPKFKKPILEGKKTTTIRLKTQLKTGEKVVLTANNKPFATAKITNIKQIKLKEINNKIAKKDGLKNKKQLQKLLKQIYKQINQETQLYLIEFKIINQNNKHH